jgi:hypothetical protein
MPFTFSVNPKEVVIVEGKRSQWQPPPVQITEATVPYLAQIVPDEPILANAFVTENIPYEWPTGATQAMTVPIYTAVKGPLDCSVRTSQSQQHSPDCSTLTIVNVYERRNRNSTGCRQRPTGL